MLSVALQALDGNGRTEFMRHALTFSQRGRREFLSRIIAPELHFDSRQAAKMIDGVVAFLDASWNIRRLVVPTYRRPSIADAFKELTPLIPSVYTAFSPFPVCGERGSISDAFMGLLESAPDSPIEFSPFPMCAPTTN